MWEERISEGWTPATHDLKKYFIWQRQLSQVKDDLMCATAR